MNERWEVEMSRKEFNQNIMVKYFTDKYSKGCTKKQSR